MRLFANIILTIPTNEDRRMPILVFFTRIVIRGLSFIQAFFLRLDIRI